MSTPWVRCGWLLAVTAIAVGGCGGGSPKPAAAKKTPGAPPAQQVQETVVAMLNKCIEASFNDSVDTTAVSAAVDRQIRLFKQYNPDAQLARSDLKAKTMRQVLEGTREDLRKCKPDDVDRVNQALTSK